MKFPLSLIKNNIVKSVLLCFLSSILLYHGWSIGGKNWMLFIALIPLLIAWQHNLERKNTYLFMLTFLSIGFGILGAILWIPQTKMIAGVVICLLFSVLFSLPFLVFKNTLKKGRSLLSALSYFILYWLVIEYVLNYSQLGFPYINIGNSLASYHKLIQWYEYTGILGGSLWILLVNAVLVFVLSTFWHNKFSGRKMLLPLSLVILLVGFPIGVSTIFYNQNKNGNYYITVSALHTNVRCPGKYKIPPMQLTNYYIDKSFEEDENIADVIVWPENAITGFNNIKKLENNRHVSLVKKSINTNKTCIISGILSHELDSFELKTGVKKPFFLRFNPRSKAWYKTYNSCINLNKEQIIPIIKEKLVPFEETIPYPRLLSGLATYISSFGKFGFSLKQNKIRSYKAKSDSISILPIICYESVFGEYCRSNVKEAGCNLMCVMLNEGWHTREQGYQHFNYFAILRAIENRKPIVKSSNCGITCIINDKGDIISEASGNKTKVISSVISPNQNISFFTKYGSIIGYLSLGLLSLTWMLSLYLWIRDKYI